MDGNSAWLLESLKDYLPPHRLHQIYVLLLAQDSYPQLAKRQVLVWLNHVLAVLTHMALPLYVRARDFLLASPDIVGVVVALVALFAAVEILLVTRRVLAWFVRLALRLAFWAVVVAVGAAVWQRGIENSVRDLVALGAALTGYSVAIGKIWVNEYNRYDAARKTAAAKGGNSWAAPAPQGRGAWSRGRAGG